MRPFVRSLSGLLSFSALLLVAITCADLTTSPGVKPTVEIKFPDTLAALSPIPLDIGDTVTLPFEVWIDGIRQERASFPFTSLAPDVIEATLRGGSLMVKNS